MKLKEIELCESKQYQSLVDLICAVRFAIKYICPELGTVTVTVPSYMVMPFMTGIDCEWGYVEYNSELCDEYYIVIDSEMNLSCEPAYRCWKDDNRKYITTESILNFVYDECNSKILDSNENVVVFSIVKK